MGKVTVLPVGPGCAAVGVGLDELCAFALAELDWENILSVVCGVEPGWDHAVALTAIDVGVPIQVVVPYWDWDKKFSKAIQKTCEVIYNGALILTNMGDGHQDHGANLYMVTLVDKAVVLDAPGCEDDRWRVCEAKKLDRQYLWKSFKEAGYGVV